MPWLEWLTGKKQGTREEVSPETASQALGFGIATEVTPPQPVSYAAPEWNIRFNPMTEKIHLHLHCDRCASDTNFDGPPTSECRAMLNKTKCAHTPEMPDATWSEYATRHTGTPSLGISFAQPQPFRIDPYSGAKIAVKG